MDPNFCGNRSNINKMLSWLTPPMTRHHLDSLYFATSFPSSFLSLKYPRLILNLDVTFYVYSALLCLTCKMIHFMSRDLCFL